MSENSTNTAKFEAWCRIELFGHNSIVGYCTETNLAGVVMLRVDVPTKDGEGVKFTRFFHGNAIYAINPIDKALAVELASQMDKAPVQPYDVPALQEKIREALIPRAAALPVRHDEDDEHERDPDEPFDDVPL